MISPKNRLLSWDDALALAQKTRQLGGKVVSTNGCFDLLHKGHVSYLEYARSQGDLLLVGINSDESVKKIKGPSRPLNTEVDRAYVLSALSCVDGVCVFNEDTPEAWLEKIKPNVHIKGADWEGKNIPEETLLKKWQGYVHYAQYIEGYSTTSLIEKSKGQKS